jgi:hypothetical protein
MTLTYTAKFFPMKTTGTGNYGVPACFLRNICRETPVISTDCREIPALFAVFPVF